MTNTDAGVPVLIASWNGAPATRRAVDLSRTGVPLLEAIVEGVKLIEDDPAEMSVGYGGLPNEDGEVELDAAVMHGPAHRCGAVAGLRGVRHAAAVALEVLRRTDHAMLVGEGAREFARKVGFRSEDLVTDAARRAWLAWKGSMSGADGWVDPGGGTGGGTGSFGTARWAGHESNPTPGRPPEVPFTFGTVHVSGVDARGDLYSCTSTSGLSYKIAGRVGDSPVAGAGIYTDNSVGSAGATGRGESTLQTCAAYEVVRAMEEGREAQEACLAVLRRIAARTRESRLLDGQGRPSFNVTLYALRKDGALGAASMHAGYTFIAQRGDRCDLLPSAALFSGVAAPG